MTSGIFHMVPLDEIVVKRDERQRRELVNIPVLMDSIRRLGLIHPIVVTRDGLELIAGERRYAACKALGWDSIPVQYVDELEPGKLRAIELEENIKRQDITWTDEVRAVAEYHRLRGSEGPGWSILKTAEALGISNSRVGEILMIDGEMERGNTMVKEAPMYTTARGIAERAKERRDQQMLDRLHETFSVEPEKRDEPIICADFTEWCLGTSPVKFNFIHCDFPYGVGADEFPQGGAAAHGGYEDTPEVWERLMFALEIVTKQMTGPSAHLFFWYAMRKGDERLYEYTARALERIGWDINPMPLIWMKSDGAGIIPDPQRGPRQIYETCFFGSRGDRKIIRAKANAYAAPTVRDKHMSEKPEPMLRHFMEMVVDENTVFLDPTCGSGSAVRAAESLGARYALGLEINESFAAVALNALTKARALRRASEVVS